ncbi:transporter substrate-binding domain-containing protein [Desulforhopalus sp. 52FAK]
MIKRLLVSPLAFQYLSSGIFVVLLVVFVTVSFSISYAETVSEEITHLNSASELDYPPFAIVHQDGTAGGFSVDLLEAAAHAVGLTVDFKVGPWSQIKDELAKGEIDVLPLVSFSEDRDEIYDFTAPYLRMNGAVFVREGVDEIRAIPDLKGKEVLVMQGDTAHEYVVQNKLTDRIITTSSFEEAFKLLAAGKHDAVVVQLIVGLEIIKKLNLKNIVAVEQTQETSLKPVTMKLEGFQQKFCFAVAEGDQHLLSLLNEGLAVLYLDGTYNTLYQKWFSPILPELEMPTSEIFKRLLQLLIPILLLFTLVGLWYLKRQVAQRTNHILQEVQQRRLTEKELATANARYVKAQELGKVGSWEYDVATQKLSTSSETKRIFGFDINLSSIPMEMVEPCVVDIERVRQARIDLIENNAPYDLEYEIVTADNGEHKTVKSRGELLRDDAGNPMIIQGVILDVTERRQSEKALRQSKQLLEASQRIAQVGGWELDISSNNLFWTDETYRIHETSPAEFNPTVDEFVNYFLPESRRMISTALEAAVKRGEGYDLILETLTTKGRRIDVRTTCEVIHYEGRPVKLTGIFQDITDQKQIEVERQRLQSQLLQAQKMDSIGTLAGGIAHDFNNILSSVIGFTELALDGVEKDTPVADDLQEVYTAGLRAKDLVQQILTFARQSDEELKPIKVDVIIKEVLKFLRSSIPTTIEIKQDISSSSLIMGSTTQIHRIMMNLLTNAAYAMENDGGILEVRLNDIVIDKATQGRNQDLKSGSYIEIKVSDTGSGIAPENIEKIFEPYFTTKGQGEGTGMGLAMVHGIVESYGGKIFVESTVNKGTTITIYLPVARESNVHQQYQIDDLPTGQERILFVDDEVQIAKMANRILSQLGYAVSIKTCSLEALELFRSKSNDFDLVISDVTMPKMTGDQLAQELIQIRADIPIILCTGYSKRLSEERASEIGINAFAYKPIVKEELAKTVRDVLDQVRDERLIPESLL